MASTPPQMLAAPMAVMPSMVNPAVHSDGWPRPLAGREPRPDNGLPWKDYGDEYERSPSGRSRTPLSRSISLSSSPSTASLHRRGSLSRKTSIVRGSAAEALKRPPREWRADFTLVGNGILSGLLGTRNRSKSFGGGANEPKVTLNPYIRYTTYKPPMSLDLRESPDTLKFRALKDQTLTRWDLSRFVCEPPLAFMRFYHAQLPWYIDVEAVENPSGVTLFDLFCAIQQSMMTPIQNPDYYNVEMTSETREQVAEAWAARCRSEEERNQGIRRVDYLIGRVFMEGIQKGKDGLWEIKTRKPGPP
ncbi:hypothetical protein LXA43DRAFT_975972 [Ganoderma leucocontextum]|nr:hypothetical protein LXA43DRAFT_975972 [Ganoderma leucocontextum]